jgi:isopenicillin N synthase-like dioxygenase
MSNESAIPILSLRDFEGQKGLFTDALGAAYREFGFVGVQDHGLDQALIDEAYEAFKAFFALPTEVKAKYHRPGIGGARGYTGYGTEHAKDHAVPDLKEFWHVGREIGTNNPCPNQLLPNVWPEEVAHFKQAALKLYDRLDQIGRTMLSAMAIDLGLSANWFDHAIHYGNSILRPIHYPPVDPSQAAAGAVRAAQHEDINLITLLIGSKEQGLEILTRSGDWIPVATLPGSIVVNVGDMLQRLTNHVYRSTTHRVINPPGQDMSRSRYSVPFFLHPNPDFEIKTLPECITTDNPDRYPQSITAHGYLMERLEEIGLLKKPS